MASRRKSEELVRDGRVRVNGMVVKDLSCRVSLKDDAVRVDGKRIIPTSDFTYIMFHKPPGVIVSEEDEKGRKTVRDYFPSFPKRIKPVGRLDYGTEGLLILTDDGDFVYRVTHPRHNVEKTYRVKVKGHPAPSMLATLRSGVKLSDGYTSPCLVKVKRKYTRNTLLEMTMHEGRNRQVRRMFERVGLVVLKLKRVRIGKLTMRDLRRGDWRKLTAEEVKSLLK